MPALGPAVTEVRLQHRGGVGPYQPVPFTSASWGRTIGDKSSCDVTVPLVTTQARKAAARVNPWEHELAVIRKTPRSQAEEVWVGPVVDVPRRSPDEVRIVANDLSAWLEGRPVETDAVFRGDPAAIAARYVDLAMAPEPSPALAVHVTPTGLHTLRRVKRAQWRMAFDLLRELAENVLDWTVVGRTLRVGPGPGPAAAFELAAPYIDNPDAPRPGGVGTRVVVGAGSADPDEGWAVVGIAGGADPARGLYTVFVAVPELPDLDDDEVSPTEARAVAQQAAVARLPEVVEAPGMFTCRVLDNAPVSVAMLVPGTRFTGRPPRSVPGATVADYALTDVRVRVSAGSDGVHSEVVEVEGVAVGAA